MTSEARPQWPQNLTLENFYLKSGSSSYKVQKVGSFSNEGQNFQTLSKILQNSSKILQKSSQILQKSTENLQKSS